MLDILEVAREKGFEEGELEMAREILMNVMIEKIQDNTSPFLRSNMLHRQSGYLQIPLQAGSCLR